MSNFEQAIHRSHILSNDQVMGLKPSKNQCKFGDVGFNQEPKGVIKWVN